MSYVNVQIAKGASKNQKAELIKGITDSLVRVLGEIPERALIVIEEIEDQDWGCSTMNRPGN